MPRIAPSEEELELSNARIANRPDENDAAERNSIHAAADEQGIVRLPSEMDGRNIRRDGTGMAGSVTTDLADRQNSGRNRDWWAVVQLGEWGM